MKRIVQTIVAVIIGGTFNASAAELETSFSDWVADAAAICRVSVHKNSAFEKPPHTAIYTATGASVLETFKGTFSDTVRLEHRGGEFNGRGETYCCRPVFEIGQDYLIFVQIREDGTLYAQKYLPRTDSQYASILNQLQSLHETGADVSNQTSPTNGREVAYSLGVLPGATGYASRFLQCDRGEPIEYLVDMDVLPSGITSNQAMTAISNALGAWEAQTSLTFKFAGFQSFGMAAGDVNISDGRIRIQLHDSYGEIDNNSNTLGRGGRSYSYSVLSGGAPMWPDGGEGGKVGPNEFDESTRGYLVIEHTKATLSDPVTLEEVLAHELGHVLSLGHSSETSGETNAELSEALMYYLIHGDGRGALLNTWDLNNIDLIYPTNTPPYAYSRIIEAITKPGTQHAFGTGVNQVGVSTYDLQSSATVELLPENQFVGNGSFMLTNNTIFFTPAGYFGDSPHTPGYYKARCFVRMNDGLNASPPIEISVVSFNKDTNGDLLHDIWASSNGVNGATADPDADGITNYQEWLLDSDPNDPQSGLRVSLDNTTLSWSTKAEELYQLQRTDHLTNGFVNVGNPMLASGTNTTLEVDSAHQMFYRVQRLR